MKTERSITKRGLNLLRRGLKMRHQRKSQLRQKLLALKMPRKLKMLRRKKPLKLKRKTIEWLIIIFSLSVPQV
jgi:hypothetical protein